MDWMYEVLEEELKEKFGIVIEEDEDSDKLQKIADNIYDVLDAEREYASYGTPAQYNYGVDNSDKREIDRLKEAIELLERASGLSFEDGHVYKYGMRAGGGTLLASYKDKIL